jgi:2-phosphosulfolactate phosphatase
MTSVVFAWGGDGARTLASECDVIVLVDVLSFTTCVSVATVRGAEVRPAPFDGALRLAPGEVLAGPRDGGGVSLSPGSLVSLQPGQRLVLPSPNGATIAAHLAGTPMVAAALRNAGAITRWLNEQGGRVGVVASGEYDDSGGWRPSYEDAVGAGAVMAGIDAARTPQAEAAVIAFRSAQQAGLLTRLLESRSGEDLVARGFPEDVESAADLDADDVVPALQDGVFTALR